MDKLASLYQERLKLKDAAFLRIEHEDAIIATVYRITKKDGELLILKICKQPHHYFREKYFLKSLQGKVPVPRIIALVEPAANIDGAVLMECFPGAVLKAGDLTHSLAHEMGALLARLHKNRTAGYGDLIEPHLCSNADEYYSVKFEESFVECISHLPQKKMEQCWEYYETHRHLLDAVDGPCLVHRDYRPGNVMVHEGKIQGIIDWSSARAGFAEEDFCSLEHGNWISEDHKKHFLTGYAGIRPVPKYDSIMPLLRLGQALAVIGYTVKSGTWNGSNAKLYEYNRHFFDAFLK